MLEVLWAVQLMTFKLLDPLQFQSLWGIWLTLGNACKHASYEFLTKFLLETQTWQTMVSEWEHNKKLILF